MGKNGGRSGDRRARIDFQLEPKERQALKLAEIREALVAAGYNTTAKQAAVLGVCRSTAWVLLNRDKRAGPSAKVIKRVLLSPQKEGTPKNRTICRAEGPRHLWA